MAQIISKDGTKIVYDRVNQGPVVVFVEGATATRGSFVELAKILAPNLQSIIMIVGYAEIAQTHCHTLLKRKSKILRLLLMKHVGLPMFMGFPLVARWRWKLRVSLATK